jgi:hypothetical protein
MKTAEFEKFKREFLKRERVDVRRNFLIVEALLREALRLGTMPPSDPLHGLETDLRIAEVINSVPETPTKN